VRLFADDTIAYLTIPSDQDARTLQSDLDKLEKWETSSDDSPSITTDWLLSERKVLIHSPVFPLMP
jgi:hypothetical protein